MVCHGQYRLLGDGFLGPLYQEWPHEGYLPYSLPNCTYRNSLPLEAMLQAVRILRVAPIE
jgi:hypothetical protein